jgi:hypothetical protein
MIGELGLLSAILIGLAILDAFLTILSFKRQQQLSYNSYRKRYVRKLALILARHEAADLEQNGAARKLLKEGKPHYLFLNAVFYFCWIATGILMQQSSLLFPNSLIIGISIVVGMNLSAVLNHVKNLRWYNAQMA